MRKNVLLKDGDNVILPITTAENVIGLGDDETEDSVYVCIWLNNQPYAVLQVPKKEITWNEYLETCSDYENYGLLGTQYYQGQYITFDGLRLLYVENGRNVYLSDTINLDAVFDPNEPNQYYELYVDQPK